jgi:cytochrome b6-f complex iron-sulfur subunit
MAEKISDLSGDERAERIAELKRKMQESAKRNRGAEDGDEAAPPAAPSAAGEPVAEQQPEPTPAAVAVKPVETTEEPIAAPAKPSPAAKPSPSRPSVNGASSRPDPEADVPSKAEMNRREFLTYAWGGALGFLALQGAGLSFAFMYPRFREGEFGGKFVIGSESALPPPSSAPQPNSTGKFWLVTTEEQEPKALYMVCTHLGCLYKWEASNGRFECPCHGSKFTRDGDYIEGPAPRSLDYFDIEVADGIVVVDTGSRNLGDPASESPAAEGRA